MKKKILLIIALIMIISTIIKTSIIAYSFINYSNELIKNQALLIKDLLDESINKDNIIKNIVSSNYIKSIKTVNNLKIKNFTIKYDIQNKNIIAYIPINNLNKESLVIIFAAKAYFSKMVNTLITILFLALISLIIIILIVNYYLTPYLELLEKIKKSTTEILKGNFDQHIESKIKGEGENFVNSYNTFLDKLKNSFGVIEKKYTKLIDIEKSNDPLNDTKEAIEQLADIFEFKRLIEEDYNSNQILNRLIKIIQSFNINNFVLVAINNKEKISKIIYKPNEVCCNIEENFESCRAYRTSKIVNSLKYPNHCMFHTCKNEYICIPFSSGGNFTGILKIMFDKKEKNEIKRNLPYIKAYLNEISSVIEAKTTLELLHNQTIIDPLTNLYNRRYLNNILPTITAAMQRSSEKIAFLMIDMDYFKKINDEYGHDIGDKALQILADILKSSIRKSDIAIRYGGEEFLIILQNIKSLNDAKTVAEKIRSRVENTPIETTNGQIFKTVSIGISLFPNHCSKAYECIKKADLALYRAKNSGRNRVIVFDDSMII